MKEKAIENKIEEKLNSIKILEKEIKDLRKELKSLKTVKEEYLVRVYVNSSRKPFRQKRFKSLESAQSFVAEKCCTEHYEQYFNLGTTISVTTEKDSEDGELIQLSYPIFADDVSSSRIYFIFSLYSKMLNTASKNKRLKTCYIDESYSTSIQTQSFKEINRFRSAQKELVESIKNHYFKDVTEIKVEYDEIKLNYEEFKMKLPFLTKDLREGSFKANNLICSYNSSKNAATISILIK